MGYNSIKALEETREIARQNIINKNLLAVFHEKYGRTPNKKEFKECGGFLDAILEAYYSYDSFVSFWGYTKPQLISIEEMIRVEPELIKRALRERGFI